MNKIIPIFTQKDVAQDHQWNFVQRKMNFDKNLNLTKFCNHPFNTISIDGRGDVYACVCQAWLPLSIGKIWEFSSLNSILDSDKSLVIQESILDGSYRYCDHVACSIINENSLQDKIPFKSINWINFVIDDSCNLSCPSCRTSLRFAKEHSDAYNEKIDIVKHCIRLIENHPNPLKFTISGDGDPFASHVYRYFLSNLSLRNKPNIEIEIVTNGILLKDYWEKLSKIHDNLVRIKISFDAGSIDVYKITRRGGNWNKLLESVKYIVDWKNKLKSKSVITANFVVQQANYLDMKKYILLCQELGIDEINFQRLQDWGTFRDFKKENIFDPQHPEFDKFTSQLTDSIFQLPNVNLTNIINFYHEFVRTSKTTQSINRN